MGWARGTELFDDIVRVTLPMISLPEDRREFFYTMLDKFTDYDWDCIDESRYWSDPDFQLAYQKIFPDD